MPASKKPKLSAAEMPVTRPTNVVPLFGAQTGKHDWARMAAECRVAAANLRADAARLRKPAEDDPLDVLRERADRNRVLLQSLEPTIAQRPDGRPALGIVPGGLTERERILRALE